MGLQAVKPIEETGPERPTAPPSDIGRIPIDGEVYREGGMWKIRLKLPEWVMHDIERDEQAATLTGLIAEAMPLPGTTYSYYRQGRWFMFGMVRFEWSVEK